MVFPDVTALTLEQLGPQVTLRAFLQNSRTASTGTPFPRSTLYINVPREIVDNEGARPLLVPFQVIITDRGSTVNCSQFEAVPEQLVGVVLITMGVVCITIALEQLFLVPIKP